MRPTTSPEMGMSLSYYDVARQWPKESGKGLEAASQSMGHNPFEVKRLFLQG